MLSSTALASYLLQQGESALQPEEFELDPSLHSSMSEPSPAAAVAAEPVEASAVVAETAEAAKPAKPAKQGKQGKQGKKGKKEGKKDGKKEKPKEIEPPAYIGFREDIFDALWAKQEEEVAKLESSPITITLPDGKQVAGEKNKTSPYDIAKGISDGLAQAAIIAKVNDKQWDMTRPLEEDCTVQFLKFEDDEGRETFWHSSAHILGLAMEHYFGGHLCYGPPIKDGFFYDMDMGDRHVTEEDFKNLEQIANRAIKKKHPFQRLTVSKEDLLRLFEGNPFKQRLIKERITEPSTTVYRSGPLIDLCRGPHIRHSGQVKAFWVNKCSSTYWEGNAEAESLQRVYAVSFPDKKMLKEHKELLAEAAKRDHRKIGREQELFFFHDLSPGSCFFLPHGARIYRTLMDTMREQYLKRGFQEVVTPNIFNKALWETSGHWQHYAENIFSFEVEKETFALKPMNCPSHCVMFGHRTRSYRELPLRYADFGVLHRNELSGALTGLTRVRRFQQDDAHIFCEPSQIEEEIGNCLDFLNEVYGMFGFEFELNLSTRPEKYLGELATWDKAEAALEAALNRSGHAWTFNPGDGAFYGPKIDIKVTDALRRQHQCATIQLDFQLPIRFNLEYTPSKAEEGQVYRPVMIHRAVLGSVERMFAILCEHTGGKWPFWLSPRQAMVIPIHPEYDGYAHKVQEELHALNYAVDVDTATSTTLMKKVRQACLDQYNFIFVVGEQESSNNTVNLRTRDGKTHGEFLLSDVIAHFKRLTKERRQVDDPVELKTFGSSEQAAVREDKPAESISTV
eukprot:m.129299 g.129299  ORF g.129299 m.129299 type:complete len:794 (-) comp15846_c0_seq2:49-2430(-)